MNLRYLFLISILVTACVFSSCSRAEETTNIKGPKDYKAQCDRGDATGCFYLGVMYAEGKVVTQDNALAEAFFRKACDGGDALGCLVLGFWYEGDKHVTRDDTQAAAFFRKACDKGEALGCRSLHVTLDSFQEAALWRKACDRGFAEACFLLGQAYEEGKGIRQSDTEALNYYGKACDLKEETGCEAYARLKKR